MKKIIYLSAIFFASAIGAKAQTNVQALKSRIVIDSLGDTLNFRTYDFNNVGKQISKLQENYFSGNLTNASKDTMIYDASDLLREKVSLNYSIPNQTWDSSFKELYVQYNANEQVTEKKTEYYSSNTWVNSQKEFSYYNANGKLDSVRKYNYNINTNVWDTTLRRVYLYNSNDLLTTVLYFNWNTSNSQYDSTGKKTYTYNQAQTRLEESIYYYMNAGTWTPSTKDVYVYPNTSTVKMSKENYYWDAGQSTWVGSMKEEYAYNNGAVSLVTRRYYDTQNQAWYTTLGDSSIIYHDYGYAKENLLLPYSVLNGMTSELFSHKVDSVQLYNGTTLAHYTTTQYNYVPMSITGAVPASINEVSELEVGVFPNPTIDFLTILFKDNTQNFEVTIYELSGKQVSKTKNRYSINVQHLAEGSYIYKITSDKKTKTGIFVKK